MASWGWPGTALVSIGATLVNATFVIVVQEKAAVGLVVLCTMTVAPTVPPISKFGWPLDTVKFRTGGMPHICAWVILVGETAAGEPGPEPPGAPTPGSGAARRQYAPARLARPRRRRRIADRLIGGSRRRVAAKSDLTGKRTDLAIAGKGGHVDVVQCTVRQIAYGPAGLSGRVGVRGKIHSAVGAPHQIIAGHIGIRRGIPTESHLHLGRPSAAKRLENNPKPKTNIKISVRMSFFFVFFQQLQSNSPETS